MCEIFEDVLVYQGRICMPGAFPTTAACCGLQLYALYEPFPENLRMRLPKKKKRTVGRLLVGSFDKEFRGKGRWKHVTVCTRDFGPERCSTEGFVSEATIDGRHFFAVIQDWQLNLYAAEDLGFVASVCLWDSSRDKVVDVSLHWPRNWKPKAVCMRKNMLVVVYDDAYSYYEDNPNSMVQVFHVAFESRHTSMILTATCRYFRPVPKVNRCPFVSLSPDCAKLLIPTFTGYPVTMNEYNLTRFSDESIAPTEIFFVSPFYQWKVDYWSESQLVLTTPAGVFWLKRCVTAASRDWQCIFALVEKGGATWTNRLAWDHSYSSSALFPGVGVVFWSPDVIAHFFATPDYIRMMENMSKLRAAWLVAAKRAQLHRWGKDSPLRTLMHTSC
jgi:hypothetical protein